MKEIIKVQNISVVFSDRPVLLDVSFSVYEGEIFAIIGGSGSGKSTLLKLMTGLLKPTKGKIIIDGIDITYWDESNYFDVIGKFGILFQNSGLIGSMTVKENIMLPLLHHTKLSVEQIEAITKYKLEQVGLKNVENLYPSELSGGMKKRAGLARALVLNPKVIFLDEPSSGLDPIASASLDDLIIELNKVLGSTIIVVTHDLESIFRIAHRAILLDGTTKGIIAEGDPKYLKENSPHPFVKAFFNRLSSWGMK